jgi:hypothetical protein
MSDTVLLETRGRIALLTLNRPAKLNALFRPDGPDPRYAGCYRDLDRTPCTARRELVNSVSATFLVGEARIAS